MGPLDRRQRELEERKELILEKSRELFFEKGFDGVTIQDICDAVEFGRSAIYGLFESKEEIYSHIYIEALKILIELSGMIDPASEDFDTEFMKLGEIIYRFYDEYTDYFMAMSHFSTKSMIHSKIPPKILEEKEALFDESARTFHELMDEYIARDVVRNVDPGEFLMLYYAGVIGIIGIYIIAEDEEDRDKIRHAVMTHTEIYREGIKV